MGEYVRATQGEDQKHLGRPMTDSLDLRKMLNDSVVR